MNVHRVRGAGLKWIFIVFLPHRFVQSNFLHSIKNSMKFGHPYFSLVNDEQKFYIDAIQILLKFSFNNNQNWSIK